MPVLPERVSVGDTLDEVNAMIREAIDLHVDGMLEDGLPIPPPSSQAQFVEINRELELSAPAT